MQCLPMWFLMKTKFVAHGNWKAKKRIWEAHCRWPGSHWKKHSVTDCHRTYWSYGSHTGIPHSGCVDWENLAVSTHPCVLAPIDHNWSLQNHVIICPTHSQATHTHLPYICYLYATYMLPICYLYATYMLPICYLYATYMLPICYLYATYMLPGTLWKTRKAQRSSRSFKFDEAENWQRITEAGRPLCESHWINDMSLT